MMTAATTLPPPPPPPPKRLGILSQYTQFYHITLLFAIDTFLFLVLNFFFFSSSTNLQIYKWVCAKVAVHLKMTIHVCRDDATGLDLNSCESFHSISWASTFVRWFLKFDSSGGDRRCILATRFENWNLHKWKWRLKCKFLFVNSF